MYNVTEVSVMKKLCKSRLNKKVCGVCGGVAEYLEIDVTIVRLIILLCILCAGTGLIAYFAAALIMPYDDQVNK